MTVSDVAVEHLRTRLAVLHAELRAAVDRQTAVTARLTRPDLTPFCVTSEQAEVLFDQVEQVAEGMAAPPAAEGGELPFERALRRRAAAEGRTLPLDALSTAFGLTRVEQDALLLVAAPELDSAYERIYAYVLDNLNRRTPCLELLVTVGATTPAARLARRRALGPAGRLRRLGLLRPHGDVPVGLAQEFTLADGLFEFLLGWGGDAGLLGHDPGEVPPPVAVTPERPEVAALGRALGAGELDLVGLWGRPSDHQHDTVQALARAAGRPVRSPAGRDGVTEAIRTCAVLGALLWVRADDLAEEAAHGHAAEIAAVLARTRIPVCLTGTDPWRPTALLAARAYVELTLPAPGFGDRRAMWSAALPQLADDAVEDLASRYRMSGDELRAVAAVAGAGARLAGNGRAAPIADHVAPAVAAVTRGGAGRYARSVVPRRSVEDLVLPEAQLNQILEIASAFRAWPRISESWGFARHGADTGVKALFTGEPGTGKTMSAEIVAGMLGLELIKVDLAETVSKWVGETEKNMEAAFRQAETSQAVLLFDEADALFGKRGDVRHGTDRYANLEVGYLLQRLEASDGLVILTSNLRDNIDPAFTRRFHFVLNFPRPAIPERKRLWRLAFPADAPLASEVDLDVLCRLDMTGAGITSAARTAALTAVDEGSDEIGVRHVVRGVARQFQRESRLLRASELGPYAAVLDEVPVR
jgi:hypothetical protein